MLDPNLADTGDIGETTNPHGDAGQGGIMQAVTQTQHGDDDVQDWDTEVLNHVLAHILNKDKVDVSVTDDFTLFVIGNGIDDVRLLLGMLEDDFKSMGHDIDFKTFHTLQALSKMCNEQVLDVMSGDDKNMCFLNLEKRMVMRCDV